MQEQVVQQVAVLRRVGIELCRAVAAPIVTCRVADDIACHREQLLRRPAEMAVATVADGAVAVVVGRACVCVAAGEIGLARRPRVSMIVNVRATDADACRELVLPTAVAVADVGVAEGFYTLGGLRL